MGQDAPATAPGIEEALTLHRAGRLREAQEIYERLLQADPRHADALNLLGVIASQAGNDERAVELIGKAIETDPSKASYFFNRGLALKRLGRREEAVAHHDRAIALKPDYAEAHASRALALQELGQLDAAIEGYARAIALDPRTAEVHYNLGNALQEIGRLEAAVESYDRAIALDPRLARAFCNRGMALRGLQRPEAALESFARAFALDPECEFLAGLLLLAKRELCDWKDADADLRDLQARITRGARAAPPFALLALLDAPALQKVATEVYIAARHPANDALGPIHSVPHQKIRVGYFSADFRDHPVSHLAAGLFESHDRERFETIGFSYGGGDADPMRRRVAAAFDHFIDVRARSDLEIAALSRELGVDIAVDLGGHTKDARTGIFALRTAPVQASYLGYLGTMGAEYFDYLFADKTIIPPSSREHYREKIAYLPWYQANESAKAMASREFTRNELGLPESGFVFCCFNKNYKIAPSTFASWMRILERVEGSVLMLHAGNATARSNLRSEAVLRGVDAARLVFAERLPMDEYRSRFRAADLFLDTSPYNAGTVAGDALWSGLPVLTRMGESFASRVAASLLQAACLPELITRTLREYEDRAVDLARNAGELRAIRARLETNRTAAPLFAAGPFTRNLERAYAAMHERHRAGLPPEHIEISP